MHWFADWNRVHKPCSYQRAQSWSEAAENWIRLRRRSGSGRRRRWLRYWRYLNRLSARTTPCSHPLLMLLPQQHHTLSVSVSNTHLYRLIVTYISLSLNINLIVCFFFCFLLLLLYYYLKAASFAQHVASRDVTRFALSHPHVVPYIIIMCVVFHYILPTTRTTLVTLEHNKL